MEIITNFNAAADRIDLTWLGWLFGGAAALTGSATSVAGDTIGWRTSGGDTFVYVNSGDRIEPLTGVSTKIELQGAIALTAANFLHT